MCIKKLFISFFLLFFAFSSIAEEKTLNDQKTKFFYSDYHVIILRKLRCENFLFVGIVIFSETGIIFYCLWGFGGSNVLI